MTGDIGGHRLVAGAAGRSLCQAIATVPGYGEVHLPWSFHHLSGRPKPTPTQLLDEVEQLVATGNYLRCLQQADPCRLVRILESATNPWTQPEITPPELVERKAQILLPVANRCWPPPPPAGGHRRATAPISTSSTSPPTTTARPARNRQQHSPPASPTRRKPRAGYATVTRLGSRHRQPGTRPFGR
jgi:hypothetical protein